MTLTILFIATLLVGMATAGILIILQDTELLVHLANFFKYHPSRQPLVSYDDLMQYVGETKPTLYFLLKCQVCLGTWIAGILSVLLVASTAISILSIPILLFGGLGFGILIHALIRYYVRPKRT